MSGRFITFEGGEGAGKTTQIALLAKALRDKGMDVLQTREPGGSDGAEAIRKLLVEGETGRWDGLTETLLHFAARRDHMIKKVWPALAKGQWVLCDRFTDSTFAYQGAGHGLDLAVIEQIRSVTLGDFAPDLTFVLDIDPVQGLARANRRGGAEDRYERLDLSFHHRLRQAFLTIAKNNPQRCVVVQAEDDPDSISQNLLAYISKHFGLEADRL